MGIKFLKLIPVVLMLLATQQLFGAELIGVNDRGVYQNRHYYELYIAPHGSEISATADASIILGDNYWPINNSYFFNTEYSGPAGYDPQMVQVNISFAANQYRDFEVVITDSGTGAFIGSTLISLTPQWYYGN